MTRLHRTTQPGEASKRLGLLVVGAGLFVGFSLAYDNFGTVSNVETILLNSSFVLIAGLGTMVLLVSGNVDLSIGAEWALVSIVVAKVAVSTQGVVVPVLVGLALGAALGLVNGLLVRWLRISPLIVTLAMNLIWGGLAFALCNGYAVYGFAVSFTRLGTIQLGGIQLPAIVALVLFVVGSVYFITSVGGLRIFAIGGSQETAHVVGVRVGGTVTGLFVVNGLLIGIVAILSAAEQGQATPQTGANFALQVLTAVILGGVAFVGGSGNPIGVLIGVLTLGVLQAGLVFLGISSWYQDISQGGILLLALVSDQLLVGRRLPWRRGPAAAQDDLESEPAAVPKGDPAPVGARSHCRDAGPLLTVSNLAHAYGAVTALKNVSFTVNAGEIVALLGDNGAGKSTVVKSLSGAIRPDEGVVSIDGAPLTLGNPAAIRIAGLQTVYQDLALCRNLSVLHNIVLGAEPVYRIGGVLRIRADDRAGAIARRRLARFGLEHIDPRTVVTHLSGGQQQAVAISRSIADQTRVLVLDEPTAALGVRQTASVLALIGAVATSGVGVVLISHDLETVRRVATHLVVLRRGSVVHQGPAAEVTDRDLLHLMAGLGRESTATPEPERLST